MASRTYNTFIILSLIILLGCRTRQNHLQVIVPQQPQPSLPKMNIPLPNTSFQFLLPPSPGLTEYVSPHKPITQNFSSREINHLSVEDPLRFKDSNTELIDLSSLQTDEYAFPLPNAKVISPYGGRRRNHTGVDIKTFANDTIVAAFDGIVRMSKRYAAYGNVIVIRHYNGLETIYSHNSKNFVKPGDKVKAGQAIALTGRTGRATTEHLHFETRINGEHFNPNLIFNFRTRELRRKCLICTKRGNNTIIRSLDVMPHQKQSSYHAF